MRISCEQIFTYKELSRNVFPFILLKTNIEQNTTTNETDLIINWSIASIVATEPRLSSPKLLTELKSIIIDWEIRTAVINAIIKMVICFLVSLFVCFAHYYYLTFLTVFYIYGSI